MILRSSSVNWLRISRGPNSGFGSYVSQFGAAIPVSKHWGGVRYRAALARYEGIPAGISSGAAVAAALEIGKRLRMSGKNIVIVLSSSAKRYQSTPLFDEL